MLPDVRVADKPATVSSQIYYTSPECVETVSSGSILSLGDTRTAKTVHPTPVAVTCPFTRMFGRALLFTTQAYGKLRPDI